MGIDPGTSTFGVACMDYDSDVMTNIAAYTISATDEFSADPYTPYSRAELDAEVRTELILRCLTRYIAHIQPQLCLVETPFINMRMPLSYVVLSRHFRSITDCLGRNGIPYIAYSPLTIKAGMGCAGKKGKVVMFDSLMANPELTSQMVVDPLSLSEHAIDAISACYCFVNKERKGEE